MFSRRGFVRIGAASVGTLALRPFGLLPALGQAGSSDYRALVCVFLFGGNDSNNMIVPMDSRYQQYQAIRGALALSTADLTAPVHTKTGGVPYSFHASLGEMATLFSSGELAVAANVGSLVQPTTRQDYLNRAAPVPANLFSHSDQQLQWQSCDPSEHTATGWAGRAADIVSAQNTSKFPTFLSVAGNALLGNGVASTPVALSPGGSLDLAGFNTSAASVARRAALENLLTLETGLQMAQTASGILSESIADAKLLGAALGKSGPLATVFPKTGLGAQLQQVAQIIKVRDGLGMRRQVFFCALGGFDTHTNELNTHKALYPQLSQALAAFNTAMTELGTEGNVTTFTESDFSRTFQATSGDGSDHAWGSHHLIMGGAVKGGEIYGTFPAFQLGKAGDPAGNDADTRGRWIPTSSIDQYGATLCSWFGVDDGNLTAVFPNFANFRSQKLGFL